MERVVDSVRRLLPAQHRKAVWFVPDAASPAGLAQRLQKLGMKPNDAPGAEIRAARMVCLDPPQPGPDDIDARPVRNLDEFVAARLVAADSLGIPSAARPALVKLAERAWPFHSSAGKAESFIAILDGAVVAYGGARFGRTAVCLANGAPSDDNGRRAYHALVRAQWEAAVAHGTPALTIAAGDKERALLGWLGFSTVGWEDRLVDDLA